MVSKRQRLEDNVSIAYCCSISLSLNSFLFLNAVEQSDTDGGEEFFQKSANSNFRLQSYAMLDTLLLCVRAGGMRMNEIARSCTQAANYCSQVYIHHAQKKPSNKCVTSANSSTRTPTPSFAAATCSSCKSVNFRSNLHCHSAERTKRFHSVLNK